MVHQDNLKAALKYLNAEGAEDAEHFCFVIIYLRGLCNLCVETFMRDRLKAVAHPGRVDDDLDQLAVVLHFGFRGAAI